MSALLPVVLLIAIGFIAGRYGFVRTEAAKDLSNLVFMVLTPALLFRTMSSVLVQQLNFTPVALYFVAALALYGVLLLQQGVSRHAAVLALACTFGNTVMIGIPLIGLAYGQAGLVTLFTLISVHALILLTLATIVLELVAAHEERAAGQGGQRPMVMTVLSAVRSGVIHPVPLPIIAGLVFAQTGLVLPKVVDQPLHLLGNAFGPVALVLVGLTLNQVRIGHFLKQALVIGVLKNMVLPVCVFALGRALGMSGLSLNVMTVAAGLPMGANVFLFAQRYEVAQELVTASMAVSTVLALFSLTLVMTLLG